MPEDDENYGDYWLGLVVKLTSLWAARRWTWTYQIDPKDSHEEADRKWEEFCLSYEGKIDRAVLDLIEGRPAKCDTPQEDFILFTRIHIARRFCGMHHHTKNGVMFSPFPPMNTEELLKYLLTDWWKGVGTFMAFDDAWLRKSATPKNP